MKTNKSFIYNWFKGMCIVLLTLIPSLAWADSDRQYVRSGNKYYRAEQYDKAELEYKKALSANDQNTQAMYNLGCAMMMQQQDSLAIEQFKMSGEAETNKIRKAMSYHNIGVIFQMHQEYAKAIEFYKEALRNNPHDHETRYNLALCQQLLKNQPQQNQNQDKQDQDKQNQDKDKQNQDKQDQDKQNQDKQNQDKQNQDKDKDKQDQDKDQQNQDQQNQDNQDKKDKQSQGQQGGQQMSRENAEQLLNAAVQEEKNTQQRLQKAMQQPQRRGLQKNW